MNPNTSHSLWIGHPATPTQRKKHGKATQCELLAEKLRQARASGAAVELPDILRLGIAQHRARLAELRERGFLIRNEMERSSNGIVLSRYWLTFDPEQDRQP